MLKLPMISRRDKDGNEYFFTRPGMTGVSIDLGEVVLFVHPNDEDQGADFVIRPDDKKESGRFGRNSDDRQEDTE